ncbi:hypothetical protein BDN70DRAFT_397988 [Pholiota conissans]|uniref:Uncharacterized protein n=1 Tax=Pholiota conissans TaxID=109636 RepID=A0A9P5YPX3_9AGAR|nr:hypothetical protein BDN70DRAFT_397988 [Pholiota conissans]
MPLKDDGTMIDVDLFVEQMREDPDFRVAYMRARNLKTEAEYYEWFDTVHAKDIRASINPGVSGAFPSANNASVRYTHVKSIPPDCPALTVRWWLDFSGNNIYNFDFIDVSTGQPIYPDNLLILVREGSCWQRTLSMIEATQNIETVTFVGPPRWTAEPGQRLRLLRSTDHHVLGEVFAPNLPYNKYPQYMPFTTLADALKNGA